MDAPLAVKKSLKQIDIYSVTENARPLFTRAFKSKSSQLSALSSGPLLSVRQV